MEALVGEIVTTPLAIDNMATGAAGNITRGKEQRVGFVGSDGWIGAGVLVVVSERAEWCFLEIVPAQRHTNLILKAGFGDPVFEILGIVVVRTPGDVPRNGEWPAADVGGGPVQWRIPGRCTAIEGFAVEPTYVVRPAPGATDVVSENAHELIQAIAVDGRRLHTRCGRGVVGFFLQSAERVARGGIGHQTVTHCRSGNTGHGNGKRCHFYFMIIHIIASFHVVSAFEVSHNPRPHNA